MRLGILLIFLAALFDGSAAQTKPAAPATRKARAIDLDEQVKAVNRLDRNEATMKAGILAIARETGVPLEKLVEQRKKHTFFGVAGQFLANELASHSDEDFAHFTKAHQGGHSWQSLAKAQRINLERLSEKLERIAKDLREAR